MWKLAIHLHESGDYLEPFSVRLWVRNAFTYHHQDLDRVGPADSEEIDAVFVVACSHYIHLRSMNVSHVCHD